MKKLLISVAMVLMLGLNAQGSMAQSFDGFEGVETVYSRDYTSTSSTAAAPNTASATASPSTNLESTADRRSAEILGITFSSEDDAKAFVDNLRIGIEESAADSPAEADAEVKDLEQDAYGFFAVASFEDSGVNAIILMADGNQAFIIDVTVPDRDESIDLVNGLADYVLDNESENEEVSFNEDGTSTGGVFDRMPAADHELVRDMGDVRDSAIQEKAAE